MKVGIVGGGITGLVLAYHISRNGHDVTVFERMPQTGGLASSFRIGGSLVERYYHHFFTNDVHLINLIKDLGLENDVAVSQTKMGVFYNKKIYALSTPFDILRFRPFGIMDKARFAFSIMYMRLLRNWKKLENVSAVEWLDKKSGRNVYEVLWRPLFKAKFGEKHELISASWLWGRIIARAKSRSGGMNNEKLCYLKGSLNSLMAELEKSILDNEGKIMKSSPVERIMISGGKFDWLKSNGRKYIFDSIISTIQIPDLISVSKGLPNDYIESLKRVEYQGVVCVALEVESSLSDIYWLNVCDDKNPLGVVIEHTNLVGKENYGGSHVIYLSSYIAPESSVMSLSDDEIFSLFLGGLKKIFPQFNTGEIKSHHVFRSKYATPVYKKKYSCVIPEFQSPIEGLYISNMSQIYPEDRNVSNSIGTVKRHIDSGFGMIDRRSQ